MAPLNHSGWLIALIAGSAALFAVRADAQQSRIIREENPTRRGDVSRRRPSYRRRFEHRNPRDRFRYPRVFDLRTRVEPDGSGFRVVTPGYGEPRGERADRAYEQGYADGADAHILDARNAELLNAYDAAMAGGHEAFGRGDFPVASQRFLLAASLNQGDPASRVCAGNAQMAVGAYESASRLVDRALELQPKLAYLPLDLRAAYAQTNDFYRHLAALQKAAEKAPDDADAWFLLGYVRFFSGAPLAAADALRHAVELRPDHRTSARLLDIARSRARGRERP